MRRFIPLVVLAALLAAGAAVIVAVDTYKPKPAVACGTNGC
jgi:predicted lysophospholipase L1 biosynthesis ABC-type transport system permease subunit